MPRIASKDLAALGAPLTQHTGRFYETEDPKGFETSHPDCAYVGFDINPNNVYYFTFWMPNA